MDKFWKITRELHCGAWIGDWKFARHGYKRQWVGWLLSLVLTVGGGTTSILGCSSGNYDKLGKAYQARGELEQAEAMYQKSLAVDKAQGRQERMARTYINLGNVYRIHGKLSQAEAMLQKSLAIYEAQGRQEGIAANYNNLGII